MGLLAGAFFLITSFSGDTLNFRVFLGESLQIQQELEATLRHLVTEIRSVGPSNIGSYPLAQATTSSLIFYSDIDKDGSFERVRYFLSGSTFKKGVIKPSGPPWVYSTSSEIITDRIKNVIATSSPIFSYYAADYTGAEGPLTYPLDIFNIRVIKVEITADQAAGTRTPAPVTLSIYATMRNLRSNP